MVCDRRIQWYVMQYLRVNRRRNEKPFPSLSRFVLSVLCLWYAFFLFYSFISLGFFLSFIQSLCFWYAVAPLAVSSAIRCLPVLFFLFLAFQCVCTRECIFFGQFCYFSAVNYMQHINIICLDFSHIQNKIILHTCKHARKSLWSKHARKQTHTHTIRRPMTVWAS